MQVQELTIQPGENANVTITALPTAVGALEDKVMCQVISSPELIEFGVVCMGAKPQVDLQVADCPADPIGQQGSKKKGIPSRDRSKSPAKAARASSKRPTGDENASAVDPAAKQGPEGRKGMTKARRPSSTSLKARPGANQPQALSTPPRPAGSTPAALPRGRGTPTRMGARPSSRGTKGSPGAAAKGTPSTEGTVADKEANETGKLVSEATPAPPKAQPTPAAEAAKPTSVAAGAKGKKGGPAVPEPAAISLEADQSPLDGTAQVCCLLSLSC